MLQTEKNKLEKSSLQVGLVSLILSILFFSLAVYLYHKSGIFFQILAFVLGGPAMLIISLRIANIFENINFFITFKSLNLGKEAIKYRKPFIKVCAFALISSVAIYSLNKYHLQQLTKHINKQIDSEYDYYTHHNLINNELKKIYLSYVKAHPERISDKIKINKPSEKHPYYFYSAKNTDFNYLMLDGHTRFDIPSNENEFEYRDFIATINSDLINKSKLLVAKEIEDAPHKLIVNIKVYLGVGTYNFGSKSFHVNYVSFDDNTIIKHFPDVCPVSTEETQSVNGQMVLNTAEKLAENHREKFGLTRMRRCYEPFENVIKSHYPFSRCLYNQNSCTKKEYKQEIITYTRSASHSLVVGGNIPDIYVDLVELYKIGETLLSQGLKITNETKAKNITKLLVPSNSTTHSRQLSGLVIMVLTPGDNCQIIETCKLVENIFPDHTQPRCQPTKIMLCKPQFGNLKISY